MCVTITTKIVATTVLFPEERNIHCRVGLVAGGRQQTKQSETKQKTNVGVWKRGSHRQAVPNCLVQLSFEL